MSRATGALCAGGGTASDVVTACGEVGDTKLHYVREQAERDEFNVHKIGGDKNPSDILTKPLAKHKLRHAQLPIHTAAHLLRPLLLALLITGHRLKSQFHRPAEMLPAAVHARAPETSVHSTSPYSLAPHTSRPDSSVQAQTSRQQHSPVAAHREQIIVSVDEHDDLLDDLLANTHPESWHPTLEAHARGSSNRHPSTNARDPSSAKKILFIQPRHFTPAQTHISIRLEPILQETRAELWPRHRSHRRRRTLQPHCNTCSRSTSFTARQTAFGTPFPICDGQQFGSGSRCKQPFLIEQFLRSLFAK